MMLRRVYSNLSGAAFDTNVFVKNIVKDGGVEEESAARLAQLFNAALQPKVHEMSQNAVTRTAFEHVNSR